MAWQTVRYKLTSSAALIQHNGQTANPANKWARLFKEISSKSSKTEPDYKEMAHLEFLAGLYLDKDGPILITEMIDALVLTAAKKFKQGQTAKSGCFCLNHARLEYEGPRTAEELWADERFHFPRLVRIRGSRVLRMRPIFQDWSAIVTLNIEDTLINIVRVDEWMRVAGTQIGLGDWRPQYGRFTAQRLNGI